MFTGHKMVFGTHLEKHCSRIWKLKVPEPMGTFSFCGESQSAGREKKGACREKQTEAVNRKRESSV